MNKVRVAAPLVVLFLLSVIARRLMYGEGVWPINYDAPYHVLLTLKAYSTVPFSEHWLLPILTLGASGDKGIPWGDTLMAGGNAFYLSFPPAGFIAPYLWHTALGIEPTLKSLLAFNFLVHGVSVALAAVLGLRVARAAGADENRAGWVALFAGASYLLAREALMAHGPTYWHHSLYQPVFLAQMVVLLDVLAGRRHRLFLALCMLGPSVEWAGYLTNAAAAVALLLTGRKQLAGWVIAATAGAGVIFLAHVLLMVDFGTISNYLGARARLRATAPESGMMALPLAIAGSVGALLLALAGVAKVRGALAVLAAVAAAPLLENLLLSHHAFWYHYDRVKWLVPLIILASVLAATVKRRALVFGVWGAAIAGNVAAFVYDPRAIPVQVVFDMESRLWAQLQPYNRPCTYVTAYRLVRGYESFSTGRNIRENVKTPEEMKAQAESRKACYGIWLTSDPIPHGWWNVAHVWDAATGQMKVIRLEGGNSRMD